MATTGHNHQNIWVVHHDHEDWHVRREGEGGVLSKYPTQEEAFEAGRHIAVEDEVELIVQGRDGKIVEKNSYGHDPRDIPG